MLAARMELRLDKNIGKKLDGRYDIQEIIGVGGMAVVYKAYDSIDDRTVAVKILKEEFSSNEEFLHRFKNESKAIAVLSHPNIVKVFDVSFNERLQYIVMEYIDGITLKEYIDQQHVLLWKEAVHFTVQILRALQHAHNKGIIHRDIKPQNIMLLQDGTIKVTDFGIAHFANSETGTMTDKAIGSVHYISPEQARGEGIDDKADIYSVGVMLFEMLTGKLPFEADSAVSVAIMQMQTDPKRPREINNSIPEGLEDITLCAMQKDPLQRYQSAADMLKDIDEFKNNPSIHFEYKYFIDENPTKYVDVIKNIKGDDNISDKAKKKKSTPLMPVLSGIAAAILLVMLVSAIFVMGVFGAGPFSTNNAQVLAPNFVGEIYSNVIANKKYQNFDIKKSTAYSDTVPDGTIIRQDTKPTMNVKPNAKIEVWVSIGPLKAIVPNVYDLSLNDATSALAASSFQSKSQKQYDSVTVQGFVISTDPQRGTSVNQSTVVTIYVSLGSEPTIATVPNLINSSVTEAKSKLESANLKLGIVTYQAGTQPKDTVLSQSTAPTINVQGGTAINVVCSSGSQDVSFDIILPQGNTYNIKVAVDGVVFNSASYQSMGEKSTLKIPAGNFTDLHAVTIYVNDIVYQQITVNFTTNEKTVTVDNSNIYDFALASSSSDLIDWSSNFIDSSSNFIDSSSLGKHKGK
jgi:serine/threonine protein kinase